VGAVWIFMKSPLGRWVAAGALFLAIICGIYWKGHNAGQAAGEEGQKQAQVQDIEDQHKITKKDVDAGGTASEARLKALEDNAAAQTRLLLQMSAQFALLAGQRQAAAAQTASLTDTQLHPATVQQLGLRAPNDPNACYNFAEERAIHDAVTQYPLCDRQVKTAVAEREAAEAGKATVEAQVRELRSRQGELTAYQAKLEGWYRELYNLHPPKYRSAKCVWIWKCGKRKLAVPPPNELKAEAKP
jgi:hypothetical protein